MQPSLRSRPWGVHYTREEGDLAALVLRPALAASIAYDRSAGYFSAETFVLAADGIEALVRNGGTMRLVVGSLMNREEAEAIERGERSVQEIAAQKACDPLLVPPGISHDALELLAWLVANKRLEVKFALPRLTPDGVLDLGHIFHQKTAIFTDAAGDRIAFTGSINETPSGWTANWETLTLFQSWNEYRGVLDKIAASFETLWKNEMRTAYVVDIPTAAREHLLSYNPPDGKLPRRLTRPEAPMPQAPQYVPRSWRQVRTYLSDAPLLPHSVGLAARTSAVDPWPHQWSAFRRMYDPWFLEGRYPRLLIADEVGLGKTIEAGLLLRQVWLSGLAKRILILTPSGVMRQWQRELREKFALDWPIYMDDELNYGAKTLREPDRRVAIRGDWTEQPFVIASSHLLRRDDRRPLLMNAEPWDLIIVDEAHHARRKAAGTENEGEPNKLLTLLQGLTASGRARGLVLLTATPMQTALVELFDLLSLLGLPYPWNDRQTFESFFERLRKEAPTADDLLRMTQMILEGASALPQGRALIDDAFSEVGRRAGTSLNAPAKKRIETLFAKPQTLFARTVRERDLEAFRSVARAATPVAALLSRHTRRLLRRYKIAIAQRRVTDYMVERSENEKRIADAVEHFIRTQFNRAKNLKDGRKRNAIGFVLSLYGKRLASSIHALRLTLERHLAHIESEHFSGGRASEIALDLEEVLETEQEDDSSHFTDDADKANRLEAEGMAILEARELREILSMISLFNRNEEDAKLVALRRSIQDLRADGYDQVIVFTQFTDTLDWLRDRLPGLRLLCYSGRGGEVRDREGGWSIISREETKRRFIRKDADVLVCTDAAAEGINLQTCGALINFDLPWNPMRVEQRIGRIDRIGQTRPLIRILNFYYHGTVESDVYLRLKSRINLFQDIVGRLQPILGRAAALIERAILEGEPSGPILAELEASIAGAEPMEPDLDEVSPSLLNAAVSVPPPPYDLAQLALLLETPKSLPEDYKITLLDEHQWSIHCKRVPLAVRVTTMASLYEENLADLELWTPGSMIFPELDERANPQTEMPATLREYLREIKKPS